MLTHDADVVIKGSSLIIWSAICEVIKGDEIFGVGLGISEKKIIDENSEKNY